MVTSDGLAWWLSRTLDELMQWNATVVDIQTEDAAKRD